MISELKNSPFVFNWEKEKAIWVRKLRNVHFWVKYLFMCFHEIWPPWSSVFSMFLLFCPWCFFHPMLWFSDSGWEMYNIKQVWHLTDLLISFFNEFVSFLHAEAVLTDRQFLGIKLTAPTSQPRAEKIALMRGHY